VLRKDKKQVIGEFFDDERIAGFLVGDAPPGVDLDFHLLERAYRGMQLENFETFLRLFVAAGYQINATNPQGHSLLELVEQHASNQDYATALRQAGAQKIN
jgi:hypothetical protein